MAVEAENRRLMLAEAVTRRLCHDMAGPVGTLGGALELLEVDPEAAELAAESVTVLSARMRLLRGAWGGGVEALDQGAIASLAPGLPGAERLRVNGARLAAPLEGTAARLCLCLLLVGAAGLPKGGTVLVGGGEAAIWLELEGPGAAWPEVLGGDTNAAWQEAAAPRGLPAALCRLLAEDAGWALRVSGSRVVAEPA